MAVARAYAYLAVGLRAVIPLAWIAAAVVATVALPSLGSAGSAPPDDPVAQGGRSAQAQQHAVERVGFPPFTHTPGVSHHPPGPPPGAPERPPRPAPPGRDPPAP